MELDRARAGALYAARLGDLRLAAAKEPLRAAVPEVFGDLHYYGRAGGRVGDALIEGGGSCEPLAQLLAAALFDAGRAEGAWLRYYGGAGAIPHLTPVLIDGKEEIDLLSGRAALPGGARFAADELVEIYARAHDLAPRTLAAEGAPGGGAGGDDAPAQAAPASMAEGYPPNGDRYPGTAPLYAGRAVLEAGRSPPPKKEDARRGSGRRLRVLRPARSARSSHGHGGEGAETSAIELRRVPDPEQIDRVFARIAAVEQTLAWPVTPRLVDAPPTAVEQADRLMALACLTALYDRASVDLTLARAAEIARASLRKRNQAADAGPRCSPPSRGPRRPARRWRGASPSASQGGAGCSWCSTGATCPRWRRSPIATTGAASTSSPG